MSGRPLDPEDSGEEQTFNYDFGADDDESSSEEEVLEQQPAAVAGRRRARGGAPPPRRLPPRPAGPPRPAWQFIQHQDRPFEERPERGVQEFILKNAEDTDDYPGHLTMTQLASMCGMDAGDLEVLNFGTDDYGQVAWHLNQFFDVADDDVDPFVRFEGASPPFFTAPWKDPRVIWLPLFLSNGKTRIDKDLNMLFPGYGEFGRVVYDPSSFAPSPRNGFAARDTDGGPAGMNTIRVDFRPGDILLCEHRGDRFIQDLTLSWPTHAGICIDGEQERAVDAMPGRGEKEAQAAVQELDIMTRADAFFVPDRQNGLVYRYIGGGDAKEKRGGFLKKKLSKKKAKAPSEDPMHVRAAAIGAATWARQQIGKAYKFSLRSHVIGVEIKKGKLEAQERNKRYVVPDKRWRAGKPINVDGKNESEVEYLKSGGARKTADTHHSMFCSELVWRAYRFGAGVTLVPPEKFFDMYKHTNRTCALLLDELGEAGLIEICRHKKAPTKLLRRELIKRMRRNHPGLILAPVQLAQSKFVELVTLVPKDGVDDTTEIRSFRKLDVDVRETAEALLKSLDRTRREEAREFGPCPQCHHDLTGTTSDTCPECGKEVGIEGEDEYQVWLEKTSKKITLSRENLYDPEAWKKYLQICRTEHRQMASKHEAAPKLVLPPRDFWDLYALEELETFERRPGSGYFATAVFDESGQPGAIFGDEVRLRVEERDLREFEYDRHPLFQLGCQRDLAAALRALLKMPLMEEDAIPHRAQLGLVRQLLGAPASEPAPGLYGALLRDVRKQLESASLPLDSTLTALAELRPGEEHFERYEQTGRVALLHAEREIVFKAFAFCPTDPRIARELIAVIDNHAFEDAITVQTAIWALGRHNDKTAIEYLIPLLDNDDFAFHAITIQSALQYLCSGPKLIPLPEERSGAYWQELVATLPAAADAWARHDARSMFWEKRQRVALMTGLPSDLAEPLRKDEVPAVSGQVGGTT